MTETNKDFEDFKEAEYELFSKIVNIDLDPTLLLIRTHLLTENFLERLITLLLERGDRIVFNGNLSYYQKVLLVDSFDIVSDDIITCLKNLNRIRNKCAHELDKQISKSDIDAIGSSLKDEYRKIRREHRQNHQALLYNIFSYICGCLAGIIYLQEDQRSSGNDSTK